ncbi:MAG: hybrid sensor histidine kinase/response regulator [Candidatus Eremiobacteraeota bacterium]|nr:hybrid sensor histidine kinase/response regulator [Candidatus Eremiobacteraeota bacterium]
MEYASVQVLLVEDSSVDVALIREYTRERQDGDLVINLDVVGTLADACERLSVLLYHLVILDLTLPDSDGLETLSAIIEKARKIPVVILTGLDSKKTGIAAVQMGAQDFITKSALKRETLIRSIRYAMERSRLSEEMDVMREDFVSTLTHDLKTPLTSIIGFTALLGNPQFGGISAEKLEFNNIIHHSSEVMLSIIENIITLSKLEAGHLKYHFASFSLTSLFSEMEHTFSIASGLGKVALTFSCPRGAEVYGDSLRIRQVFQNLVLNALHHTPPGGSITVKAEREGKGLAVEVADTGKGITVADQQKLFQKFAQGSGESRGMGLGLYLVDHILRHHRSRISIESAPGAGTMVRFALSAEAWNE